MSLVHDIVKAKFVREGYLPNYPYHLVSDSEMCDAFIRKEYSEDGQSAKLVGYFVDNYPCLGSSPDFKAAYEALVCAIFCHINYLKTSIDAETSLPDWVYSYMLGTCVSIHSDTLDIHDLLVMVNEDNIDDQFTSQASAKCLEVSTQWVKKDVTYCCPHCYSPLLSDTGACPSCGKVVTAKICTRPPTMFGEPHVIKSLRLTQIQSI